MSLNHRQKDIAGLLAEWREVTDKATPGPWVATPATHGNPTDGPTHHEVHPESHARDHLSRQPAVIEAEYDEQGWLNTNFAATSRTAMPALLTAVENVLKLHHDGLHDECAYQEPGWRRQRCHFCGELWPCATVTAIRDALGGAE